MRVAESGEIRIKDLRLSCIVGVFPEERRRRQEVVLQLRLGADLSAASRSDDLAQTVDYKEVKQRVIALVEASSFRLVERLAGAVAEVCLRTPGVLSVEVEVEKPGALRFARAASVVIRRTR